MCDYLLSLHMEGGESMDLYLLEIATKIVVKTIFKALAKFATSRIKKKIAPIHSRDDLENR